MAISTSRNQVWCASPDWSVGSTTGSGIPEGFVRLGLHRTTPAFQQLPPTSGLRYGALDDLLVPERDARPLLIEHGFLAPYFRKMFWARKQFEERARARDRVL